MGAQYIEQLRAETEKGHPDDALVGVPVGMIRSIVRDLTTAQAIATRAKWDNGNFLYDADLKYPAAQVTS